MNTRIARVTRGVATIETATIDNVLTPGLEMKVDWEGNGVDMM